MWTLLEGITPFRYAMHYYGIISMLRSGQWVFLLFCENWWRATSDTLMGASKVRTLLNCLQWEDWHNKLAMFSNSKPFFNLEFHLSSLNLLIGNEPTCLARCAGIQLQGLFRVSLFCPWYRFILLTISVDGAQVSALNVQQLKEQASIIKSKSIRSIVVIGIYSPSNPKQEDEAKHILLEELGSGFDISCSHAIGRIGFIERENASILNASLRRFARHVIAGFSYAVQKLGRCNLYITLNDGTLSKAHEAAQYPVKCFRSGPTNSARGAALLAKALKGDSDDKEILVIDIGGWVFQQTWVKTCAYWCHVALRPTSVRCWRRDTPASLLHLSRSQV